MRTDTPWSLAVPDDHPVHPVRFPAAPDVRLYRERDVPMVELSWSFAHPYQLASETYRVDTADADGTPVTVTRQCDRCDHGIRLQDIKVDEGRCWGCNATGFRADVYTGAFSDLLTAYRKRSMGRVTRQRADRRKHNAVLAARRAWLDAHPDVTAAVARFDAAMETLLEPLPDDYATGDAAADRAWQWREAAHRAGADDVVGMLLRFSDYGSLTDRQVPLLLSWIDRAVDGAAAYDSSRYVGTVGAPYTYTGVVTTARTVRGAYGLSRLVVLDGAGADAGAAAKFFTSAGWAFDVAEGDRLTFKATVSAHDTDRYDNTRVTEFKRPTRPAHVPTA